MAIGLAMLSRIRPDGPFTTSVLIPSLIIAVGVGLATVPLYATSTAGSPVAPPASHPDCLPPPSR
jgi:hypothetical protein